MADYIYNPSESIKQGFQQAQAGVGNIFAQIIHQQQRDYTMAESAFQNIEALKKDVNIFGQKNITSKSNELLKQAGAAILKDGKLDYSKLGEIRQGISDIKDLKAGYDVGAKEYERMLQLGIANKDNLVSFEKFYKDLSAKMADENLVKNPQDLQRAMADTYSNNLDDSKMFIKSFSSANPMEKTVKDIIDPKTGALMRVEGVVPKGWSVGADGKVIPKPPITTVVNGQTVTMDYADQELARLQASDPDLLATLRKKSGVAGANMSDKDIVKFYIDNKVVAPVSATQIKSASAIEAEGLQVNKLKFDVANQGKEFAAKMRQANASASSAEASAAYYRAKASEKTDTVNTPEAYAQGAMYTDSIPLSGNRAVTVTGAPLGKNMKLSIGNSQAIVTDVAKSTKSGDIWAKVLTDDKGALILDESKIAGAKQTWRKVSNPAIFKKTIDGTIHAGGYANKEKPYAQALVNGVFNAPSQMPSGNASPKPAPATAPVKGKYQSGQIEGNVIYLDKSLKSKEGDILEKFNSQYGVTEVKYIN